MGRVEGQGPGGLLPGLIVDEAVEGIEPHHAAGVPDGPQLIVRQVPGHPHRARQLEWEAITGPAARSTTSQKPPSFRWDTSTAIPSLPHPAHGPAARLRQPRLRIAPGACCQGVGLVPGEHPQPDALAVVPVHARGSAPTADMPSTARKA